LSRFPRIVAWLMLAVLIAAAVAGVIAWRSTMGSDSGGPLPVQVTRPTGKCTIAFRVKSGDWADAPSDVYVIEPDGRGQRNATRTPKLYEWDPVWSPDGRKLAFSATRTYGPATQVFVINADGSGLRQLTHEVVAGGDFSQMGAWSSEGRHVRYTRIFFGGHDPKSSSWVLNADGGGKRRVRAADPSPDGRWLLIQRSSGVTGDIYGSPDLLLVSADGRRRRCET
jgi:Tol biopolymer transport system component